MSLATLIGAKQKIDTELDTAIAIMGASINDEALLLLRELDGLVWVEAHYDSYNGATKRLAQQLEVKLNRLNMLLGFRR